MHIYDLFGGRLRKWLWKAFIGNKHERAYICAIEHRIMVLAVVMLEEPESVNNESIYVCYVYMYAKRKSRDELKQKDKMLLKKTSPE